MKRSPRKTPTRTATAQLSHVELVTVTGGATFGEVCLELWDKWTEKWTGVNGGMSEVNSALAGGGS